MAQPNLNLRITVIKTIGPLHDPVTWYKIIHAGEQVAQWDFQNNATCTSPPGPSFVLEVPLRNLLTSRCDFVPCDRIVQRAYWVQGDPDHCFHHSWYLMTLSISFIFPITVIFLLFQTRKAASWLAQKMTDDGHAVALLSGEITVEQRIAVFNRFREGKEKLLITVNDVFTRGIDVEQVRIKIARVKCDQTITWLPILCFRCNSCSETWLKNPSPVA